MQKEDMEIKDIVPGTLIMVYGYLKLAVAVGPSDSGDRGCASITWMVYDGAFGWKMYSADYVMKGTWATMGLGLEPAAFFFHPDVGGQVP
jgi:hypothetical protein